MRFCKVGKNEIFQIKKTIGFSKIIQNGKPSVFPLAYDRLSQSRQNHDGYFRRKKTRKKRAEKPHQTIAQRSVSLDATKYARKLFDRVNTQGVSGIFV